MRRADSLSSFRSIGARVVPSVLSALLCAAGVAGCGDDPTPRTDLGRTVYLNASVVAGGSGAVDDPVASIDEALALEFDGPDEVTFIFTDGAYAVPTRVETAYALRWVGGTAPGTVLSLDGATLASENFTIERLTLSGDATQAGARIALLDVALVDGQTAWTGDISEFNRVSIVDAHAEVSGSSATLLDSLLERSSLSLSAIPNVVVDGLDATEGQGPLLRVSDSVGSLNDVSLMDAGWLGGEPTDTTGADELGTALLVVTSDLEMTDIVVERPLLRGLVAEGSDVRVLESDFRGGGRAALAFFPGESALGEALLTEVSVSDATILLFSSGAAVTVQESDFRGGGTAGALVSGGTQLTITNSTMLDCPNGHISVIGDTSGLQLRDSVVQGAANESCVSISSTTAPVEITGNTISGCAGAGVSTLGVVDALIAENDVSDIAPSPLFPDVQEGISLVQSVANIRENVVHDFGGTGIALLDSGGTVAGNRCADLGGPGVRAVERGTAPLISSGNVIERANVAGIFVFNVEGSSTGDIITDTRFDVEFGSGTGIAVSGPTSFDVQDATISGSAQHGIYVDSDTTLSVSQSEISTSQGYAIACASGATLSADGNTYAGNALGDEDARCTRE